VYSPKIAPQRVFNLDVPICGPKWPKKLSSRVYPWEISLTRRQFARAAFVFQLQACAFNLRKRPENAILKPGNSPPELYHQLGTPIECVSICFAFFPGGVSEPKGNFSTLSAYTFTKYRWVIQAEGKVLHNPAPRNHSGIERCSDPAIQHSERRRSAPSTMGEGLARYLAQVVSEPIFDIPRRVEAACHQRFDPVLGGGSP
jgi:hypothetical protein